MANQELVALVASLSERFNSLLEDVRAAVRVGAFKAMAKLHGDATLGMSELFAFQEFVRARIKDVEFTQRIGERIMSEDRDYVDEATELLRERGYSLTKGETNEVEKKDETKVEKERDLVNVDPVWTVPKVKGQMIDATCADFLPKEETNEVEAKEVDATCPSFLNGEQDEEPLVSVPSNGLCEKEVDAAKKTVRAFFCDAVGFMRNAVMAGAFTRDELDELAADVADSFSQAWQWREDEPWKKDKAMRNVRTDLERNK